MRGCRRARLATAGLAAARCLSSLVVVVALVALSGAAAAQLSPGPLSAAHGELEGSAHCLDCHQSRRGVDPDRCLSCHEALAERIAAGRGLHAGSGYRECETCHIEHHGTDFELVWWGDDGIDGFDHREAGYALEGAHRQVGCRECHRPRNIVNRGELVGARKDLSRTFLGLETACLSCHVDEHRGQVAPDSCLGCHTLDGWSPASGFDHSETRFPLHGRHREVECAGCHGTTTNTGSSSDAAALRFEVAEFATCGDCHADPHAGRLGADCESCHSTDGWRNVERSSFDHDRTRFSLAGAHRKVSCTGCHPPGRGFRVSRFERCADCHEDAHAGQLADPASESGCESCHSVERFVPADFTLEDHQRSSYPLVGAHLAVPCISCHREVPLDELWRHWDVTGLQRSGLVRQFRFAETRCVDCHLDPHEGEVDRWMETSGCESCHALDGWDLVTFDHERTEFPLRGRHRAATCDGCHPRQGHANAPDPIRMTGLSTACASCHEEPHAGQFSGPGDPGCEHCHGVESWQDLSFDHVRDSRFPLVGAHRRVACSACHAFEVEGDTRFVRYKPLEMACESCHG